MIIKHFSATVFASTRIALQPWIKWVHNIQGRSHCLDCLALHGCWFAASKAPLWPHHLNCHCTLEPIDFEMVLAQANSWSDYSKFDSYLFNTQGQYVHSKEKLFAQWGYTVQDAHWLQREMEQQALKKYTAGDYELGLFDHFGQRISIRIEIPRKDEVGKVSFISGWLVYPNGQSKLVTPYGGK